MVFLLLILLFAGVYCQEDDYEQYVDYYENLPTSKDQNYTYNITIDSEEDAQKALAALVLLWLAQEAGYVDVSVNVDTNTTTDSDVSLGSQMSPIPPMFPVRSSNQQAPLDPSGKWTRMLLNKRIYTEIVEIAFPMVKYQEFKLKDDGTFLGNRGFSVDFTVDTVGIYDEKGFWWVDETSGILYLQYTYCDGKTCPTDPKQYTLKDGRSDDTIYLDKNEYTISEIDG
eukprot:TRINITY_DN29225_c0_g3_i1.p1 TRINITY_DN29225_c0_g3~~TRINITY_DN29225_c0_g3_i1.p1  ORF type:complete len:227 (+),score=39.13 TRINITY_DN29225_c0_g3_i1:98-778(+)